MSAVLGVIPARLGSVRLPRKPLHPIAGRPLIEWVWRSASATGAFERLVVATDSREIADAVRAFGGEALLTDPGHPSGTDRAAEVARMEEFRDHQVVVNLQGDEPFLPARVVSDTIALVRGGEWEVATAAVPLRTLRDWQDPATVKVVIGEGGRALYFSRAPVPHPREGEPDWNSGCYLRHLGLYVFRREALLEWVSYPEGELERIERLEQLRALGAGMEIGVSVAHEGADGVFGIDTPADAERAALRLSQRTTTA